MQADVDQGFSFDLDAFRAAYARFLAPAGGAAPRILLTGHSHQAWPDAARDALVACFDDAARLVDDKWDAAVLPKLAAVGEAILERMGFDRGDAIAFGQNTHELVYRLITALPRGPLRIVTTQGEFHSLRRQLARLAEEGVEVEWVSVEPRAALADRLLAALRPGTSMLAISAVLFESATVVPRLDEIVARAAEIGAVPLVDAYHAFNVVPIAWGRAAPHVYAVAGGYKYAAMGEGICWMRVPPACALRPVFTGWFADFGALAGGGGGVAYAPGGARFAGSTFDPSALYRAAAALEHWDRFGLTVPRLRAISLRQTGRILGLLDAAGRGADVISPREPERRGGFVAVRCARAGDVVERLRARRVLVDARGEALRIGPAPYLTDAEIDEGVAAVLEELGR
ncbi:aminotransferase class V-fold PLP-dependent enzyme [Sorangium sp. So ce1024]|uniref:aminotransferase class V-fold PLP-dependent enzyme n=1 Tax=Sorangium sp. So ce1024 TaxID=3133327 RepID=UPI003F06B168